VHRLSPVSLASGSRRPPISSLFPYTTLFRSETIDTLEAMREAKRRGAHTLAILNVKGSSISREADDVLYIHAGPEIGVASTKAFLGMVAAFALLALWLGRARQEVDDESAREFVHALR